MVNPLFNLWNNFVEILPGLIAAIILLVVGYFVASILGYVLHKILEKLGFDKAIEKAELSDALGHMELSALLGTILKWYIFIIFLGDAATLVNLGTLSVLLNKLLLWLPSLILAVIIFVFGLIVADFTEKELKKSKIKSFRVTGPISKVVIIFFVLIIALRQIGFYIALAETTFLMVLGSICLAFAIAVGIGFGVALKDEAKDMLKKFKKKF